VLHLQRSNIHSLSPRVQAYDIERNRFVIVMFTTSSIIAWVAILDEANNYACPTELRLAEVAIKYAENKKSESLRLLAIVLEESFELYPNLFAIIPAAKSDVKIQALIKALKPI